jgi:hypothetical protein
VETRKRASAVDGELTVTSPAIHIKDLRKVYIVSEQEAGTRAVLQGLVQRRKLEIPAVDGYRILQSQLALRLGAFPRTNLRKLAPSSIL